MSHDWLRFAGALPLSLEVMVRAPPPFCEQCMHICRFCVCSAAVASHQPVPASCQKSLAGTVVHAYMFDRYRCCCYRFAAQVSLSRLSGVLQEILEQVGYLRLQLAAT